MGDPRRNLAAGDLYTAGPNPGRLVVDYDQGIDEVEAATEAAAGTTLLDRVLAATEALRAATAAAKVYENEPFMPGANGGFVVKRGRPRKGRKTLRDYGLTKQQLDRARLLASIPETELTEYWRTHRPRSPALSGTLVCCHHWRRGSPCQPISGRRGLPPLPGTRAARACTTIRGAAGATHARSSRARTCRGALSHPHRSR